MINVLTSILLVIVFLFFGQIIQALQRVFRLFTTVILFILNLVGIKLVQKEKEIILDKEFYEQNKDINKIMISKKNLKKKSSIDWIGVGMLLGALILFIINLQGVSDHAISNWIYNLISSWKLLSNLDVNTFFTATIFSIISFAISRILNTWKETKELRKERKEIKLKNKAIKIMNTKELLDAARRKNVEIVSNKEE